MDKVEYIMEPFECPDCGERFPSVWLALGHLNKEHTTEEEARK